MKAVRGYLQLAPLMVAVLVLVAAGCSSDSGGNGSANDGGGSSGGSGQAQIPDTLWSEYLPVQKEEACTLSSYDYTQDYMDMDRDVTLKVKQTLKYADVRQKSDGTHFTLNIAQDFSSYIRYEDGGIEPNLSFTQERGPEYVLADDGTLRGEPQVWNQGGIEANFDEFIVYPTVEALRNGESKTTTVTGEAKYTDSELQSELENQLEPGEDAMKMRLTYTAKGLQPEEITTSAGTFTDVVGVSVDLENAEIPNMNAEEGSRMGDLGKTLTELKPTEIVWFARDVGIVQSESRGGLAGAMSEGTTSGEDTNSGESTTSGEGQATPPLKLQGCGGNEGGVFDHVELDKSTAEQVAKLKDAAMPQAKRAAEFLAAADNAGKYEPESESLSAISDWGYENDDGETDGQSNRATPHVAIYTTKVLPQHSSLKDPLMLLVEVNGSVSGNDIEHYMAFSLDPEEVSLPQSPEDLPELFDEPGKLNFLDVGTQIDSNWVAFASLDYTEPETPSYPTPIGVGQLVTYAQEDQEYVPADSRDIDNAISTAQEYNTAMLGDQ